SHIRSEQLRLLLHHARRNDGAPGMTEEDQRRIREPSAQLLRELDAVGNEALARDAGGAVLSERSSRSTLVPLHEHEILLVRCMRGDVRRLYVAGPAVQEEQNRISAIVAAHGDPLLNTANGDEGSLFDALGGSLRVDRAGGNNENDATRGNTSHAAYDGSAAV